MWVFNVVDVVDEVVIVVAVFKVNYFSFSRILHPFVSNWLWQQSLLESDIIESRLWMLLHCYSCWCCWWCCHKVNLFFFLFGLLSYDIRTCSKFKINTVFQNVVVAVFEVNYFHFSTAPFCLQLVVITEPVIKWHNWISKLLSCYSCCCCNWVKLFFPFY